MLSAKFSREPSSRDEVPGTLIPVGAEVPFESTEPDTIRMQELIMMIRPLQDHVIVKRAEEEEQTKGGILIPDTAKEKPLTGVVIAVGTGRLLKSGTVRPLDIQAGDRVIFTKHAGAEVRLDGEEHLMLREDEVLGVLEG
jgi:chaperonin GroES